MSSQSIFLLCSRYGKVVILNVFKTGINAVLFVPAFKLCTCFFSITQWRLRHMGSSGSFIWALSLFIYFRSMSVFPIHVTGCLNEWNNIISSRCSPVPSPRGTLEGLVPQAKLETSSNGIMKHYESVKFLSNFQMSSPPEQTQSLSTENFLATVLVFSRLRSLALYSGSSIKSPSCPMQLITF